MRPNPTPALSPALAPPARPYVLVVEDDPTLLTALSELIARRMGSRVRVESALNAEEALELVQELLARREPIGVVLSDVILPGMKGHELLPRIHALSPNTINVLLTGQAAGEETQVLTTAVNEGHLFLFLRKEEVLGHNPEELVLKLEAALKAYVMETTLQAQNHALKALFSTGEVLGKEHTRDGLLHQLLPVLVHTTGATRALVALARPEQEGYHWAASWQEGQLNLLDGPALEPGPDWPGALALEALGSGDERYLPGSDASADLYLGVHRPATAWVLPLRTHGTTVGLLHLEHQHTSDAFSAGQREVVTLLAITAATALENADLFHQMEQRVGLRTRELLAALSDKDRIINIVSHEIRGPIGGIAQLAQMLTSPENAADSGKVLRYGGLIHQNATTVLRMANAILDLAKLQAGGLHLNPQEVNLATLCQDVLTGLQAVAESKGIQLTTDVAPQAVLMADPGLLTLALNNLLGNALKFTPKGGQVALTVQPHGADHWQLTVQDTGIGIAAEDLPRLFEPFGARSRTGTAGEKGTGLGLPLVKEIAQQHGGSVHAESTVGLGTTLSIRIPR